MAYFKHNRIRTEDRTLCNLQTDKLHNHDCKEEERLWKVTSPSRASEPERDRHARKCSCHLVSHGSSPAQLSHHCCGCVSGYRSATSSFHDDYVDGKQAFDVSCAITKTLGSSVMHIRKNVQLFTFVDILITLHSGKLHPWSLQFVAHPCSMSLNLSKYSIAMLKSSMWRIILFTLDVLVDCLRNYLFLLWSSRVVNVMLDIFSFHLQQFRSSILWRNEQSAFNSCHILTSFNYDHSNQ